MTGICVIDLNLMNEFRAIPMANGDMAIAYTMRQFYALMVYVENGKRNRCNGV